jgi:hypothetical protein
LTNDDKKKEKRKEGKDTWSMMTDIDMEYFVKNVIMKAN